MSTGEFETALDTKPTLVRQAVERQEQSVRLSQPGPLAQTPSPIGGPSTAGTHASRLNRIVAFQPSRAGRSLLQLQWQYGNRYVQRVIALARKAHGDAQAAPPEVEEAIQWARGGGQALDSGVRAQMEPAFGADFSGVRVHTDTEADALNRAVSARAFTAGQDIFFREGKYNPHSSGGRELLAHELTHVVQQVGGVHRKLAVSQPEDAYEQEADQVAQAVARQERQATAKSIDAGRMCQRIEEEDAETVQLKRDDVCIQAQAIGEEAEATESVTPTATELIDDIISILQPVITKPLSLKQNWKAIEKHIKNPKPSKAAKQTPFSALYDADLIKRLESLGPQDRAVVASRVFERLVESLSGQKLSVIQAEFDTLSARVRQNIEGGLVGYVSTRQALLNNFGTLTSVNKYYATLVSAEFPSASSKIRGHDTLVHPVMKERLAQASRVLRERGWLEIVENSTQGMGGFSIRENRNSPDQLSNHSFGWAIDIDAEFNPNVKKFPAALVQGLTGEDVFRGEAAKKIRATGSVDEMLTAAQTLRQSSDKFRQVFEDEPSLAAALATYVKAQGVALTGDKAALIVELVKKAHAERNEKKKNKSQDAFTALVSLIFDRAQVKQDDPTVVELLNLVSPAVKTPDDLSKKWAVIEKQINDPSQQAPKDVQKLSLRRLYDKKLVRQLQALSPDDRARIASMVLRDLKESLELQHAQSIAEFLLQTYQIFLGTRHQTGKKTGQKVEAQTIGTAETIAAHGFINLAPELIAALVSPEGGGLKWLGAIEKGTKDFMHFELKASDQPSLSKEASTPEAAILEENQAR